MSLIKDVLPVFRRIRRRPTLAAAVLLTVALGVGVSAVIFSLTNAAILEPLPFDESERLMVLWTRFEALGLFG